MERGEKTNFPAEKPENTPQPSEQVSINRDRSRRQRVPWICCDEDSIFTSALLLPKNPNPCLTMRKVSGKPKLKGNLQNIYQHPPQNHQGHHKQGKSKKLSQTAEA